MVQFRSETMVHGTLVIPSDRGHEFIDVIGRHTNIHIVDMNATTGNRPYKNYIQRIDEMERILRFLFEVINQLPGATIEKNNIGSFLEHDEGYQFDLVEDSLQKLYSQFVRFRDNNNDLQEQGVAAIEERAVAMAALRSLSPQMNRPASHSISDASRQGLLELDVERGQAETVGFSTIAGVVAQADQEKFGRTIHRATRGNAFTHYETVEDGEVDMSKGPGNTTNRTVFVIYYQGAPGSAMAERILRISKAFGVRNYTWPRNYLEAELRIAELTKTIVERASALEAYENYQIKEITGLLEVVRPYGNSLIEEWRLFCMKEKAIYAALNLFEGTDMALRAYCWYPARDDSQIREVLMRRSNVQQVSAFLLSDSKPLPKSISPPTYFRCPEFTLGFQNFVDTYGVPRYKEANPALVTIITLPVLFGIMYGDVGHGSLILLAGLYMILFWNTKLKFIENEILQILGGGRYMITLMGIFAVYSGFMYNDFFALGMDIFGSRYRGDLGMPQTSTVTMIRDETQAIYPFGFDPVWKGATNEIDFFNSFKMKFSVIIAFVQMGMGVLHKASNALYFKDYLSLWFEFVPQIIFLSALVGWMDFLIIYKWVVKGGPKPSIITTVINMFFFTAEDPFWPIQKTIQSVLVLVMVVCIPVMLLVKPLVLKARHSVKLKERESSQYPTTHTGDTGRLSHLRDGSFSGAPDDSVRGLRDEEEFEFSEVMIHQMIHTIEFVLGTISNTASYLRLWALSLAHQQLSLVFFENIMLSVLRMEMNGVVHGVVIFIAFAIFAGVTFGVMICMDSLECFLHALRLQWVEFQNKFYDGDGYKFVPFRFVDCLSGQQA